MALTPAIVVLSARGAALAERLLEAIPGAEIHGLASRVPNAGLTFTDTLAHLQTLFRAGRPIVGICASGILIRALAPVLDDKKSDPPVIAVAESGDVAVPLLGGHHGANMLATSVAATLGATAAITTASDKRLGAALDEPPAGLHLATSQHLASFVASILAGQAVRLEGECHWLAQALPNTDASAALSISVTHERVEASSRRLVYHPQCLAVGVGCERGTEPAELITLVNSCLDEAGLAPGAVAGIYSLDLKSDETAMHALAANLDRPARFFPAAQLELLTPRLENPSEVVFREVGCHGVSEGAALAAAGAHGQLLVTKTKSKRATCAIALAPEAFDGAVVGSPRGRLYVVGVGPGAAAFRIPRAGEAITDARHVVGYGLYLDLVADLLTNQQVHRYALGEETERVKASIAMAAGGQSVALVCSGDAGIYAMAALVYEQLDNAPDASWRRVDVNVVPGVSALQAAAALSGAPIGHDFCAISLSDLLTPWSVIERRLEGAGAGDFVIALYNPSSKKRQRNFDRAVEILRSHRGPQTPVVIGKQLGREQQSIEVCTLGPLSSSDVDMLSVVLIGSSTTTTMQLGNAARVYTPRGYADKYGSAGAS
ncbi:MAG: precorrin-3B C(17)-methyltransferase [Chromatiales bacterium]|jgi:cobalt-precorrin 5A hydrolase / precorrin-3B C17-methyltransferase|nr:precorrin-3B C(17)-methyltransferase [Chromatiales bacterium]